ncbi:hypothetical protein SAMN05216597_5869 [Pseudomonas cannabina]|uniref:Oligopeptide ABC transporter, ATP-binding protein n=1 Tax=Pseudomonas cannabina TaxID=86840 RepID=A0A0P9LBW8_PSECA|nr:hypothetical protein ALO81_200183 [Pseudomonas cannabina]SDR55666.1 hypothetical protein SAMN05216597_5869 [Pseudomonas cannabina]
MTNQPVSSDRLMSALDMINGKWVVGLCALVQCL